MKPGSGMDLLWYNAGLDGTIDVYEDILVVAEGCGIRVSCG